MKIVPNLIEYQKRLKEVGGTMTADGIYLLNESAHIADAVIYLTQYIKDKILDWKRERDYGVFILNKNAYTKYLESKNLSEEKIEEYTFFREIEVSFSIWDYENEERLSCHGKVNKDIKFEKRDDKTVAIITRARIELRLGTLNGNIIPKTFSEPIQHEVNHLYQKVKKYDEKPSPKITNHLERKVNRYELTKTNTKSKNKYIKMMAEAFHYLDRGEQDAYVNGLYSNLKDSKVEPNNLNNFIQNTFQYIMLNNLKETYNGINGWNLEDNDFIIAKDLFFGKTTTKRQGWASVKSFLNNEIPNFERKLGGVVGKYRREYIKENTALTEFLIKG